MIQNMTGKIITEGNKNDVLRELIDGMFPGRPEEFRSAVFRESLNREAEATTVVEKGIAFPHAILDTGEKPAVGVGFSGKGVVWDTSGEEVNIIVLLVCREEEHLSSLAELASIMQVPGVIQKLNAVDSPDSIIHVLRSAQQFRKRAEPVEKGTFTRSVVDHLCGLVNTMERARIILFTNSPEKTATLLGGLKSNRVSILTNNKELTSVDFGTSDRIDEVFYVQGSLSLEKEVLRELWSGDKLPEGEIVIGISGFEYDDIPHRISISAIPWDLYNETRILNYKVPRGINLEIISRVIFLATELARQGREGKPVGTIFVVGEYEGLKEFCKQLIINPFNGLHAHEKSILDPSLSETIKEFSKIDGAFIIGNDGIIHSAGTYLSIPPNTVELQPGLGARHAAAVGITLVAPVVSVVISESTGNIRVFWNGTEQDIYRSTD